MTERIPPTPQPVVDRIAALLGFLDREKAKQVLLDSMTRIADHAKALGWSHNAAWLHVGDFGLRVAAAMRANAMRAYSSKMVH